MYARRKWSVRHARQLEWLYTHFERVMAALHPLWQTLGYRRIERPVAFVERHLKGLLFDCRMCGHCVLSSTGMSCPMNCPKQLRNGPCGGVRADGNCEVEPDMPCVWVEAHKGGLAMRGGGKMMSVQAPVDWSIQGKSSWLREAQTQHRRQAEAGQ